MSKGRQQNNQTGKLCRLDFVQVCNEGDGEFWHTAWVHHHNGKRLLKLSLCSTSDVPILYSRTWRNQHADLQVRQEAAGAITELLPELKRGSPSFSLDVPEWAMKAYCGPSFSNPEWMSDHDKVLAQFGIDRGGDQ